MLPFTPLDLDHFLMLIAARRLTLWPRAVPRLPPPLLPLASLALPPLLIVDLSSLPLTPTRSDAPPLSALRDAYLDRGRT